MDLSNKKTEKPLDINLFVKNCEEYCKIIESIDEMSSIEVLQDIKLALLPIYVKTHRIVRPKTKYEHDAEKFVSERQYNKIRKILITVIGTRDNYNEIFNPEKPNSKKSIQASLSEDLTDIYQDLKDFVQWYTQSTFEAMNDALIELVDTFGKFWGMKLLNAVRYIHAIQYIKPSVYGGLDELEEVDDDITDADKDEDDEEDDKEDDKEDEVIDLLPEA
jgi:hypothetical protein